MAYAFQLSSDVGLVLVLRNANGVWRICKISRYLLLFRVWCFPIDLVGLSCWVAIGQSMSGLHFIFGLHSVTGCYVQRMPFPLPNQIKMPLIRMKLFCRMI